MLLHCFGYFCIYHNLFLVYTTWPNQFDTTRKVVFSFPNKNDKQKIHTIDNKRNGFLSLVWKNLTAYRRHLLGTAFARKAFSLIISSSLHERSCDSLEGNPCRQIIKFNSFFIENKVPNRKCKLTQQSTIVCPVESYTIVSY